MYIWREEWYNLGIKTKEKRYEKVIFGIIGCIVSIFLD